MWTWNYGSTLLVYLSFLVFPPDLHVAAGYRDLDLLRGEVSDVQVDGEPVLVGAHLVGTEEKGVWAEWRGLFSYGPHGPKVPRIYTVHNGNMEGSFIPRVLDSSVRHMGSLRVLCPPALEDIMGTCEHRTLNIGPWEPRILGTWGPGNMDTLLTGV